MLSLTLYLLTCMHYTLHLLQKQEVSVKFCKNSFSFLMLVFHFDDNPSQTLPFYRAKFFLSFPLLFSPFSDSIKADREIPSFFSHADHT